MPMMNGLELLKRVMEEKLCDCVILMSQFSDFEYARQGLSSGAFDYLLKPVGSENLLNVLLRAAKYISEKKLDTSRIQYLDKLLNQSIEEYFPTVELNDLINSLNEESKDSLNIASYLVDSTFSESSFECIKTGYIINKVMRKLIETVQEEFPWVDKFYDIKEYKVIDFSQLENITLIKEMFVNKIDTLLQLIRKYELGIDSSMVRMACKTILQSIDTDITINSVSRQLFITRTYLSQIFKDKTGINLVKYLTDVKIERAKFLVANGNLKNNEISEILGYKDDEYFKKLFKKATGMTISEYKNKISN